MAYVLQQGKALTVSPLLDIVVIIPSFPSLPRMPSHLHGAYILHPFSLYTLLHSDLPIFLTHFTTMWPKLYKAWMGPLFPMNRLHHGDVIPPLFQSIRTSFE